MLKINVLKVFLNRLRDRGWKNLNVRGFTFNPTSLYNMKIRIYAIIKLKMQSNISFENIRCDYNIF
jgi:hypothetical protein